MRDCDNPARSVLQICYTWCPRRWTHHVWFCCCDTNNGRRLWLLNRLDSVIFTYKYILHNQLRLKAGADEKQVEILNGHWSSSLLSERGGFNSAEAPQGERQQKSFAKDAPRWHHVKSIRDNMDVLNHSNPNHSHPISCCKLWIHVHGKKKKKKTQRHNKAAGTSDLIATHVRNSECAKITYVHE